MTDAATSIPRGRNDLLLDSSIARIAFTANVGTSHRRLPWTGMLRASLFSLHAPGSLIHRHTIIQCYKVSVQD